MTADLGVVHLVREANGLQVLRRFLDSYRRHPAGTPHELVLLLKGFEGERASEPYRKLAADLSVRSLEVPDDGFDLGAYRRAALALPHDRLLLLNSFSVILADGWLEYLLRPTHDPRVGAVAASGSWGSQASHVRYSLGLGGPYSKVFADRASTQDVFAELTSGSEEPQPGRSRFVRARELATTMARQAIGFKPFPAPHVRTNGLLIERQRWLEICHPAPRDKLAAHRLESGRGGIVARLRASGLEAVVVGRDGQSYLSDAWPASFTFWQGDQENLLIADNQTFAYQVGDAHRRRVLSGYAWGGRARPAQPTALETT